MATRMPTREERQARWDAEASLKERSEKVIAQYRRGLHTHAEFIANLQALRLDDYQWETPAATFPEVTASQYVRLAAHLGPEL